MSTSDEPLLVVDSLSKAFGGVQAVRDASLTVRTGSITSLIGPNGAGKSTVFNLVAGALKPDSGCVRFRGQDITGRRPHAIAAAGLTRTFQSARVFERMTVMENLLVAGARHPGERLLAAFFSPRPGRAREKESRELAQDLLERTKLARLSDDYASALSGGQRKLLELARLLMTRPRLALLDEPMAGVNPSLGGELVEHLLRAREVDNVSFLIVEHDLDLVMSISDTVVVMNEGTVLVEGSPAAVQSDQRVIDAYLGGPAEPLLEQPRVQK
jgi:ABC-type branched-subunit amino acid transport system ATPase component